MTTRRVIAVALLLAGMVVAVDVAFSLYSDFRPARWTREHPLSHPLPVHGVMGGRILLEDGRVLSPAGVTIRGDVDELTVDRVLSTLCRQGIEIVRDLGDGRAIMNVEPKFHNWCGTSRRHGFAGAYFQGPLSEYLVYLGCAVAHIDEPGLTEQERSRLRGFVDFFQDSNEVHEPWNDEAFRFDGTPRMFLILDEFLP